jgi:hypothetical protein
VGTDAAARGGWRDRFRAPSVSFPTWATARPDQLFSYADVRRRLGGVVDLHVYPAGHHAGSVVDRLTHAELELAFLARHLGGPAAAVPARAGTPRPEAPAPLG